MSHPNRQPEFSDDIASMALLVRRAFDSGAIAYAEHQQAAFAAAREAASAALWQAILARLTMTTASGSDSPSTGHDAPVRA